MKVQSHKDLKVWQESMLLVEDTYSIVKLFPSDELYGLTSQMRRASISVPSNIAEGAGRKTNKEWMRFLYIAMGSLSELETQMELAVRLKFVEANPEYSQRIFYIRNMLSKLIASLS
tara:strand:- start:5487 stop:5837 length:351 start_codon:yes stop_codon:yes gene_type:complete